MKKRWMVKSVTLLVALSFVLASVCMALTSSKENTVTVSKEADSKASFTVVSTSQLQVKNNVVANIIAGTKAYYVINSFKESCFITDKSGNTVTKNAIVATGYTLVNSMTLESMQLAVNGDTNGDGRINGVDIIRAKKLMKSAEYSCYLEALDMNRDGKYTNADIDMIVTAVMDDPYKMADTAEPAPTLPIGEEFYARIMGTSSGKYLDLTEDNVVINTVKNTRKLLIAELRNNILNIRIAVSYILKSIDSAVILGNKCFRHRILVFITNLGFYPISINNKYLRLLYFLILTAICIRGIALLAYKIKRSFNRCKSVYCFYADDFFLYLDNESYMGIS
jgi:organic hydroperoxide reductase OsmC/OhrA